MSHSRSRTSGAIVDHQGRLQRILLEGFGRGDLSVIDQLVAPRVVEHQDGHPQDRNGLRAVITGLRTAFPDLSYKVLATAADGETAWAHARVRGTNRGPFKSRPPTGRSIDVDVIDIARFRDGRLVEHWGVPDRFAILEQLGWLKGLTD